MLTYKTDHITGTTTLYDHEGDRVGAIVYNASRERFNVIVYSAQGRGEDLYYPAYRSLEAAQHRALADYIEFAPEREAEKREAEKRLDNAD